MGHLEQFSHLVTNRDSSLSSVDLLRRDGWNMEATWLVEDVTELLALFCLYGVFVIRSGK